ncbi:helix-turn-helix domain-containing protein [Streptomyces sp. NA02950]|uniref:helix-turn-helix domain-containing protein n=1 Tax=Streptomyces sp. NA02950 TaxID=2742137 RepID=UPI0015912054|nr:helix-turn-helix transcriptional regulator [Streptomyces sp. NA02950]QKV95447.1 helix-turn-helix domain-containing protein [Streptomyces sp. NA02950]
MVNISALDPSASPLNYYGYELRRLRESACLTLNQLGKIIFCTGSLIGQIETARKAPTRELTERADAALEAEGALLRLWPLVARSQLPGWFQPYAEMEAIATYISTYQTQLVHGLLQTEEYAREVLGVLTEDRLDVRVEARSERQRILARTTPPAVWVVLGEAVLHGTIGGPDVMRRQLAHLLSFRRQGHVNVQVLPFTAGAHAGLMGSFTVLRFKDEPDILYTPDYNSGHMTFNPTDLRDRSLRYDHLQAAALSLEDSAELIVQVMEERYGEHP